jgi:hypothetical protein
MNWHWLFAFFSILSTVAAVALWRATAINPHNDVTAAVTGILAVAASLAALFGWAILAHLFFKNEN